MTNQIKKKDLVSTTQILPPNEASGSPSFAKEDNIIVDYFFLENERISHRTNRIKTIIATPACHVRTKNI